jgi:hypothetical protein
MIGLLGIRGNERKKLWRSKRNWLAILDASWFITAISRHNAPEEDRCPHHWKGELSIYQGSAFLINYLPWIMECDYPQNISSGKLKCVTTARGTLPYCDQEDLSVDFPIVLTSQAVTIERQC